MTLARRPWSIFLFLCLQTTLLWSFIRPHIETSINIRFCPWRISSHNVQLSISFLFQHRITSYFSHQSTIRLSFHFLQVHITIKFLVWTIRCPYTYFWWFSYSRLFSLWKIRLSVKYKTFWNCCFIFNRFLIYLERTCRVCFLRLCSF